MMDQIAAIQRLKQIWAARRGKWTAPRLIGFVLNVLAVTFALAFLAMIAWPIARMLPCIGSSSIAVDIVVLLAVGDCFRLHKGLSLMSFGRLNLGH
jgi:hypothetical protein